VEDRVDHIGPCHAGDSANCVLGNTILKMSTHTTVSQLLTKFLTVSTEFRRVEYTIVRVVVFDTHIYVGSLPLKQ
jgi:hypothetical protein